MIGYCNCSGNDLLMVAISCSPLTDGATTSFEGDDLSTLTDIQSRLDSYPPSIRRVADTILATPQVVLELTITELAHACSTSETTVVRFCRTLGFSGFSPFKLSVAADLATESAGRAGPGGRSSTRPA